MIYRSRTLFATLLALVSGWLLWCVISAWEDVGDYPWKIWLHRCNSMEKLQEKYDEYPNVEVDVVFRKDGGFDVTHDLDTTFNLNIEEYFRHYSANEGKMWLDIKNINTGNRDSILNELEKLTEDYRVSKERLIIESPQWEHLEKFTRAGFYTSYYVAYDKPSELSGAQEDACIDELEKIARSGSVKAISFPYWWYGKISRNLEASIDFLTWKHHSSQFLFLLSLEGKIMLKDSRLKVVLVKDKGKFHR